ncbi:MAG: hypothetical protein ACREMY_27970 [bacterium]
MTEPSATFDPFTLTSAEATAALARMQLERSPPPPIAPATAADARARLDVLAKNKGWADRLFANDIEARREFAELSTLAAGADDVADTLAGTIPEQPIFETTVNGALPSRTVAEVVASMREAGLADASIEQALRGGKVTSAEVAAAKAFQNMRHGDAAWVNKFLAGDYSARREHMLLSVILSSEIKDG